MRTVCDDNSLRSA